MRDVKCPKCDRILDWFSFDEKSTGRYREALYTIYENDKGFEVCGRCAGKSKHIGDTLRELNDSRK